MRTRTIQRKVYLNENENEKLKKIIDESGMTISQIFRSYILGTEIKPRPPDEIIKLYRELSAIGNNINQLAYKANGLGVMNVEEVKKCSYTMEQFWQNLKKRDYVIHRKGKNIKHISILPPFGKYPIRLESLGKDYTEDAIRQRIIATRNGIITASPTEMPKKQYRYKGNLKNVKGKKLKGFIALYFRYLYLFKKIERRQTPQRVSFFMRDEVIKFERYQKQFKFLYSHNIETGNDLQKYQTDKENEIDILIGRRKKLYEERNDENCDEIKEKAKEINAELTELRKEVRMCKAIFKDSYKISEKHRQAKGLQQQADKEMRENEYKRRIR